MVDGALFSGRALRALAVGLVSCGAGCGGRSSSDPDPYRSGVSAPEVSADAAPPAGCATAPPKLNAALVWQRGATGSYGLLGAGMFGFSPDGERIVSPPDQYLLRGYEEYASANGDALFGAQVPALARDRAWTMQLVAYDTQGASPSFVADLRSGRSLLSLDAYPRPAALVPDGSAVITLACQGVLGAERHGLDGSVSRVSAPVQSCDTLGSQLTGDVPPGTTLTGDVAAFLFGASRALWIADFAKGTLSEHAVSPPAGNGEAEPAPLGTQFSPSGRSIAIRESGQPLRVLSYPGLTQQLPDIDVAVGRAYGNCYCQPRSFAPVAWSFDERLLATTDRDDNVVVRSGCDGTPLFTITRQADDVPAFLAFAPDGHALAVLSLPGGTSTSSIAYYQLSY